MALRPSSPGKFPISRSPAAYRCPPTHILWATAYSGTMQACPCTRLRLLWQTQRNWRPPRPFTTTPRTRNLSQAAESVVRSDGPGLDPYVSQKNGKPKETTTSEIPDAQRNEAKTAGRGGASWNSYDELWGAAADAVAGVEDGKHSLKVQQDPAIERREETQLPERVRLISRPPPVKGTKTKTHARHPKAKSRREKQWPPDLVNAHGFFRRTVSSEDYLRANAAFWMWKKKLSETWQMVEASQLPLAESESNMLRWLLEHKDGGKSVDMLRQAWLKISPERRRDLWPAIMMSALRSQPGRAHDIFTGTFDAADVPYYAAQDTIHHLSRQLAEYPSADGSLHATAEELFGLVKLVLEHSPPKYLRLRQATIFFIINGMDTAESVGKMYHLLIKYGHPLHKFTLLQMASRIAKGAASKMPSVEMLQAALSTTDLDINTPQGAALCTTILSGEEVEAAGAQPALTPAEMFEHLLRCGLEPNIITYTTIIRGLCLKGELEAAQQVLDLMIKNQSEPDEYVYSTMMNGAKLRGHFAMLRQVAETAAAERIRHPIVWNDFLQAIYSTAFAEARQNPALKRPRVVPSFPLMLQAYVKLFAFEPLSTVLPDVGLGGGLASARGRTTAESHGRSGAMHGRWEFAAELGPTVRELPQLGPADLMTPTASTLTTMILGYIQGVSNPYDVVAFYSHFRRLLQAGNPVVTGLVRDQGTLVHDVVVMALCEFEGMLRVALDVVGDMLRDASVSIEQAGSQVDVQQPQEPQHPPPSVYTWSILLNGFMFHRQVKQGERILHMMRDRGIEPNLVTWNTLMAGYARLQNVKKTAVALQRLERAGFEPDDFTFRAFSYLGDKSSILRYMEMRRMAVAASSGSDSGSDRSEPETVGRQHDQAEEERQAQLWMSSRPADAGGARELRKLEDEVKEIAKMMDREQRDGAAAVSC